MSTPSELEVLQTQLDELLSSGIDDADEALEVAALAGMLVRLGAPPEALADAETWRVGPGADALDEAWDLLEPDELVEAVEEVALSGDATEAQVEEVVLDFDEVVAAAVWCGRTRQLVHAAAEVEQNIRLVPEVFAALAPWGRDLARSPAVVRDLDVYGFWLAVADAGEPTDDGQES